MHPIRNFGSPARERHCLSSWSLQKQERMHQHSPRRLQNSSIIRRYIPVCPFFLSCLDSVAILDRVEVLSKRCLLDTLMLVVQSKRPFPVVFTRIFMSTFRGEEIRKIPLRLHPLICLFSILRFIADQPTVPLSGDTYTQGRKLRISSRCTRIPGLRIRKWYVRPAHSALLIPLSPPPSSPRELNRKLKPRFCFW